MDSKCQDLDRLLRDDSLEQGQLYARLAGMAGVEDCIQQELERSAADADWETFGRYVWAAYGRPARRFAAVLSAALDRHDEDVPNEDVADVLGLIGDPVALPSLHRALRWEPEDDEFHALAVKAVDAIAEIGTPEAVPILRAAAADDRPVVRDSARSKLT